MAHAYRWMTVDRVTTTVLTFSGNVVLARLLTPYDFGLLAMVAIFTAIAYNASGCGLSDGLINKSDPTERDYSTVFVFNAAMGLGFAILFILCSGLVANFFEQEALRGIMIAIGICFFFQTLSFTQETRMRKEMNFKKIAIVHILANTCAIALGITLAATGYSYWGLVSCRVFLSVFLFVFYIIATKWLPRLAFDSRSFHQLFGYGVNLMWAYILTTVSRYISMTALGKQSSAASGLYSQAQKMEEVPFNLTDSIFNWPFFSVLSNEHKPFRRALMSTQMFQWLCLLNVTLGMLLMLLSSPGFMMLFGPKWQGAVPVFRVLVIMGIAMSLKFFFQTVMKTHSRTALVRNLTIVEVIVQLGLLAIAFPYGIIAIAWSQAAAIIFIMLLHAYYYMKLEQLSLSKTLSLAFSPLGVPVVSFVIAGVGYWLWNHQIPSWLNCLGIVTVFIGSAIVLWEMFPTPVYKRYRATFVKAVSRWKRH